LDVDLVDVKHKSVRTTYTGKKDYMFVLVLPASAMDEDLNNMKYDIRKNIQDAFFLPFVAASMVIGIGISLLLRSMSIYLTAPIIDLFQKIQAILKKNEKDKEEQFKQKDQQIGGESQQKLEGE